MKEKMEKDMKLVYLCKADPPPPESDFYKLSVYFENVPQYLKYAKRDVNTQNSLIFADRIGEKWPTDAYSSAVAFVSTRFVDDEKAMRCFEYAAKAFPDILCIDIDDSLSSEQTKRLQEYTHNIYSSSEGIDVLIQMHPNPDAKSEEDAKTLVQSIEKDGYSYLDKTITTLEEHSSTNKSLAGWCYFGSFLFLLFTLVFAIYRYSSTAGFINMTTQGLIAFCFEVAIISAVSVSLARFLFLLGKSFMVESIRNADRAHAIGLGKLYLQLYKDKFQWDELKDVLQNWNIDKGSAFIGLDAKDIETIGLEKIVSSIKNKT